MKYYFFVILITGSINSFAEAIPGETMLNYFSASCNKDEWSSRAREDARALIETLRTLATDEDCQTVGGAISKLVNLEAQVARISHINDTKTSIARLEAQEQQLLFQYTGTSDANVQFEINSRLRELQLDRAALIGQKDSYQDQQAPDRVRLISEISSIANSAFTQLTANQKCMQKPGVLNQATAVLAGIGSAATILNPVLGATVTAGANFVGEWFENSRKHKLTKKIREIANRTYTYDAYRCALESMSTSWCQMRDAESFLAFKNQQRNSITDAGLAKAIRLNDREIPALIDWLEKVKSGVPAATTAQAGSQNYVTYRKEMVDNKERKGLAWLKTNERIYDDLKEDKDKWNYLLNTIIKGIAPARSMSMSMMNSDEPPSALNEVMAVGYIPYFLLGIPDSGEHQIKNDLGYKDLDSWDNPKGYRASLTQVRENFKSYIAMGRAKVKRELTQELNPDSRVVLNSAYDPTGNKHKIRPVVALKTIVAFLNEHPLKEDDGAFKKLYSETITSLEVIITEVERVKKDEDLPTGDKDPLQTIFDQAQLQWGTVVLESRLELVIRLSLLEYLQNAKPTDQILVAQLMAAERLTDTINKMSGTENLAMIADKVKLAKGMTEENLNSMMEIFGGQINHMLAIRMAEEQTARPSRKDTLAQQRRELCFLILSADNVDDYVDSKYCSGLKLSTKLQGAPVSLTIKPETFNLDISQRACARYDYYRNYKIFQDWKER